MKKIQVFYRFMTIMLLQVIFFISIPVYAQAENISRNPGFENALKESDWSHYIWDKSDGITEITVDTTVRHTGEKSLMIRNVSSNDARMRQEIPVSGNRYYKLTCWVKTDNVGMDNTGANLSIEGLTDISEDIRGTSDWTLVTLFGKTKVDQKSFALTLGLGGYGSLNTGKAWFDDVNVEELDTAPSLGKVIHLYKTDETGAGITTADMLNVSKDETASKYNISMLIYVSIFISFCILISYYLRKRDILLSNNSTVAILFAVMAAALLIRLFTASIYEGWPNDISANKYWAKEAAKGISSFYSSVWCDYPPLFVYVLSTIGKLSNLPWLSGYFTLLIKLPSILADIVTATIIYRIAAKQGLKPAVSIAAAAAYAFHPAVFINSTIWGQVDSFFTMLIVTALFLLMNKKFEVSAVFFAASLLMKPQAVFFFPVLLFALIKERKLIKFATVAASGLITVIIIILPFAFRQEPFWIINLYLNTMKEYSFATMNAFNLFSLIGANFKDGSQVPFLFSYNTWGILFDISIVMIAAYFYIKSKHPAIPVAVSILLNAGAFIFSVKMHERYLYPVIALSIILLLYFRDKRFYLIFTGFSITVFANIHILFYRMLRYDVVGSYFNNTDTYPVVFIFSLLNIIIFIYFIKLLYTFFIKNDNLVSGNNNRNRGKLI